MQDLWKRLVAESIRGSLSKDDAILYKKWGQALHHLAHDPRHPGLASHEIGALSRRYGIKVWQSYLENRTPSAGRIYWAYGPGKDEITIIGLEPHPEDKKILGTQKSAYQRRERKSVRGKKRDLLIKTDEKKL